MEVVDMGSNDFTFDKHVIYVHLHILPDMILEDLIHRALVSSTLIFKTGQHNHVTK